MPPLAFSVEQTLCPAALDDLANEALALQLS